MASILIVDDDCIFRRMLRVALQRAGHEVIEADNGREALALYVASNPGLVITDMLMPDGDGSELITELRERQPALRIIAVSASSMVGGNDFRTVALLLGADLALAKPFPLATLTAAVAELVVKGG